MMSEVSCHVLEGTVVLADGGGSIGSQEEGMDTY